MTSPEPRGRRDEHLNRLPDDPGLLDDPHHLEPLGGADAVQKTTYTAPSGSDPADEPGTDPVATARVSSSPFLPLTAVALLLALLVLVLYGIGFFR